VLGRVKVALRRLSPVALRPTLTALCRRSRLKASGREASRHYDLRSPRGVEQEAQISVFLCFCGQGNSLKERTIRRFKSVFAANRFSV